MNTQELSPAPTSPPAALVDHDRNCTRCSYNLRGLAIESLCPECGSPVKDSLRGILLRFASPGYLATIHRGVRFVLIGIPLKIFLPIALIILATSAGRTSGAMMAIQGVSLLASALIIYGYWLYTEADPGFVGDESAGSARAVARSMAIVSAAIIATQAAVQWMGLLPLVAKGPGPVFVRAAFSVASSLAVAGQYFAMMRYSRWLARRIPDESIVRRATTLAWLLPSLEMIGGLSSVSFVISRTIGPASASWLFLSLVVPAGLCPLAALILYWTLLGRIRKHLKSIRKTGFPARIRGLWR